MSKFGLNVSPQLFTRWFYLEAPLTSHSTLLFMLLQDWEPTSSLSSFSLEPFFEEGRCLLLFRPHHWLPALVRNRSACAWSFPLQPGSFSSFLSLWCSGAASTVTGSKVPHTLDPTWSFFRRKSSYRSWKLECSFSSPTIPPWLECPFST